MTDNLHGPLMAGIAQEVSTPGESELVLDYLKADGASLSDILNDAFHGPVEVAAESFFFASDTRLILNIDGVIVYWNAKATGGMPLYWCNKEVRGTFVILAIVAGEVTCFLSKDQISLIADWLGDKQVTWYGQFHSTESGSETQEEGGGEGRPKLH